MEEQVWAAGVICTYSLLMQKVLSQQLCGPHHHNCVNIAWRLKVIRSQWGREGTCVHLQEFHGRLCWCRLLRHRPGLVTDLPKQGHSRHHTPADFSGHTVWSRDGWPWWLSSERGGWREGRVCFRGACSAWITNYKRKVSLPPSWWSTWKFARLEVLRVGYSSESAASPKLTMMKEMLHFPDQLSLYSLCTVPQQTMCPMGLQLEIILFSLQQSSKINSQFITILLSFLC